MARIPDIGFEQGVCIQEPEIITVLYVEDSGHFLDLVTRFFEERYEDVNLIKAEDGREGFEIFKSRSDIDCIVSDYEMPEMNGIELLGEIRNNDPDIPFILFTGKGNEDVASDAVRKGATDYIQKGEGENQFGILYNRVNNYVEQYYTEKVLQNKTEELNRKTEFISQALNRMNDLFYVIDMDRSVVGWNERVNEVTGYTDAEIHNADIEKFFPKGDAEEIRNEVSSAIKNGSSVSPGEVVTKNGERILHEFYNSKLTDKSGEVIGVVGVARDLSERWEYKRELDRQNKILQQVLSSLTVGVAVENPDGEVVVSNEELFDILGVDITPEDIVGKTRRELFEQIKQAFESEEEILRLIRQIDSENTPVSSQEINLANGRVIELDYRSYPIDGELSNIWILRDITQHKMREQELAHYETLVENIDDIVFMLNQEGKVAYVNDTLRGMMGYDPDEIEGTPIDALESLGMVVSEDEVEAYGEKVDRVLRGVSRNERQTLQLETEGGDVIVTDIHLSRVDNDDGELLGAAGVSRDITEQKEREKELAEYETILQNAPIGMFTIDDEGVITWANEIFADALEKPIEEVVGMYFVELVQEGYFNESVVESYLDNLGPLLSSENEMESFDRRQEFHTPDGETRFYDGRTALLPLDDGEFQGTVTSFQDITQREQYKEELEKQNERLDNFATLVSHDLRNPLNVVKGRLKMVAQETEGESEQVEAAVEAADRMEEMIDEILSLAREGDVSNIGPVDLETIAEVSWENVDAPSTAEMVVADSGLLYVDEQRVKHLFENLFKNSVEHSNSPVTITVGLLEDGFYIEDTGPGISEKEREKVFETGYTTSEDGTGFGLGIVKEVANGHSWDISISESDSGGARFELHNVNIKREKDE